MWNDKTDLDVSSMTFRRKVTVGSFRFDYGYENEYT